MEAKEIRRKGQAELKKTLSTLREKLRDLRFKTSGDQLKNVREIRTIKKDIAKILTIFKESEIKSKKLKKEETKKN